MRKVMFSLLALLSLALTQPCLADFNDAALLSLINLKPGATTQSKVTSMLGTPSKIEYGKKTTLWYYTHGISNLVVSWKNKTRSFEKFFYKRNATEKKTFDNSVPHNLKSGSTNISEALKLLGTPKDLTIKEKTQEMHYAYDQKVLRLFFRDHVLVDYCLY